MFRVEQIQSRVSVDTVFVYEQRRLFHFEDRGINQEDCAGTNPVAADAIARSDFDMARAGSAKGTMFGPGIYLAENASKSDEYAKEGDGIFVGQCALLLCRATAGKVVTTPEKADHSALVTSGTYDCVCGDRRAAVGTFREMVFFDSAAVYTEYIIIYHRLYDEQPPVPAVPAAPPIAAKRAAPPSAPSTGKATGGPGNFKLVLQSDPEKFLAFNRRYELKAPNEYSGSLKLNSGENAAGFRFANGGRDGES